MDVTIELDTAQASAFVRAVWSDQLPFATSAAINASALGGQKVQREHQREIFHVRRRQFVDSAVKISQFATKDQPVPEARMRVEPLGGRERADIIEKFETDETKESVVGGLVAVPTRHVPRTAAGIIKDGWRPRQILGSTYTAIRGKQRTDRGFGRAFGGRRYRGVLIQKPHGATIYAAEEFGRDIVALYQLVPQVRIEPELKFRENITRHVLDNWDANFSTAFDRAMRTAR